MHGGIAAFFMSLAASSAHFSRAAEICLALKSWKLPRKYVGLGTESGQVIGP
jgi:hypothetical protein